LLKEDIQKALKLANEMESKGIIGKYAVGGAIGTIYWTEAYATKDLDLFLRLPVSSGGLLLMPFMSYLAEQGYPFAAQYVKIGNLMVDFLGVYNPLTEEALDNAVEINVYDIPSRVFRPEYLMAIALQTGRVQDLEKIIRLYEQSDFDEVSLEQIIKRHNLSGKWNEFKKKYLSADNRI
jgi:hypothetical protein